MVLKGCRIHDRLHKQFISAVADARIYDCVCGLHPAMKGQIEIKQSCTIKLREDLPRVHNAHEGQLAITRILPDVVWLPAWLRENERCSLVSKYSKLIVRGLAGAPLSHRSRRDFSQRK